jgi:hypothetical protein
VASTTIHNEVTKRIISQISSIESTHPFNEAFKINETVYVGSAMHNPAEFVEIYVDDWTDRVEKSLITIYADNVMINQYNSSTTWPGMEIKTSPLGIYNKQYSYIILVL